MWAEDKESIPGGGLRYKRSIKMLKMWEYNKDIPDFC